VSPGSEPWSPIPFSSVIFNVSCNSGEQSVLIILCSKKLL
jgi:hypothetical protein